ncbi:MAG: L,D-transpeptidase family protein [Pseudoruegeria sp.]
MFTRRAVLGSLVIAPLAACSSKFKSYNGPEVTRIAVYKERRKMYLLHHDKVLEDYDIDLGFSPEGHKQIQGDGKTPEGNYRIDRRNPNSSFHLSLGISYPNVEDVQVAREMGKSPGGDIFIHGARRKKDRTGPDWTWGCISVSNKEMEDIYAMVRDGTIISIYP